MSEPKIGPLGQIRYVPPIVGPSVTLREMFAAMAMQNMATKELGEYSINDLKAGRHIDHADRVASAAVLYADALLAELNKPEGA